MEFVLIKAVAEIMVYQGVVESGGEKYFFFATIKGNSIEDIAAHSLQGERVVTVEEEGLRDEIKNAVAVTFLQL